VCRCSTHQRTHGVPVLTSAHDAIQVRNESNMCYTTVKCQPRHRAPYNSSNGGPTGVSGDICLSLPSQSNTTRRAPSAAGE